ncbi:uncharacterized protein LOC128571106 [Nycticebus coucang]|uniref:uncharacterized protein LOC128571106 n=1 Tax=Nycticebus coucang TaxID=9470 RepID=UPI00234D556A|nr:uncharacterized protein LOC128571106 [Nycticebus coucang]
MTCRTVSCPQPGSVSRLLRVCKLRSPSKVRGVYSPASWQPGHRRPCPRHPTLQRIPAAPPWPYCRLRSGLGSGSGKQNRRPQGEQEGGVLPARAPPPHAQSRTSPPCAPSLGSAFLPGKEKRSGLGRRLLKGQHRPSRLILPTATPPSPPNTCRVPSKTCVSLLRPSLLQRSVASGARWLGRAGPWVGFAQCLAAAASAARKAVPGAATSAWMERTGVGASAHRLARLPGMLDSPPQSWLSLLVSRDKTVDVEMSASFTERTSGQGASPRLNLFSSTPAFSAQPGRISKVPSYHSRSYRVFGDWAGHYPCRCVVGSARW